MFRKLIKLASLLLVVTFLIVTVAFTSQEGKDVTCSKIEVNYKSNDIIHVAESDVIRLVKAADSKVIGKTFKEINTEEIEREVEKLKAVEQADVYMVLVKDSTSFKGVLSVRLKHREPVVRIMSPDGNYYFDKKGHRFPASINYTANVMTVTGKISDETAVEKLLPFVEFLKEDNFWKAQIQQIHVQSDGDAILTPLVGDQLIELGSFDNYEKKLRNMKAFYEQVLAKNNWDKYNTVSVKYDNQVIAKKR